MIIAIVTPTYYRENGKSLSYLENCWKMLQAQTHTEWKWFLTGDCYENRKEIEEFVADKNIDFVNTDQPGERGILEGYELWCNAGATALNLSIDRAIEQGYSWIAHLDDDDTWCPNHLEKTVKGIKRFPNSVLVHTQSILRKGGAFPKLNFKKIRKGRINIFKNVIHSSVTMDFSKVTIRYKNRGEEPADANMWKRIYKKYGKHRVVHVPAVTVDYFTHNDNKTWSKK